MTKDNQLRLASDTDLASVVPRFEKVEPQLTAYRADMLDHPIAGKCLRNFVILTECPELFGELGLSEVERFWSRYYWLARFAREWKAAVGDDAGLEQQVLQLLEHATVEYDPLPEVDAAAARDAVL